MPNENTGLPGTSGENRSCPDSGYHRLASYYRYLFPLSEPLKKGLVPLVEACLEGGGSWLDVGCGTGELVRWLRERGIDAVGVDPEESFLQEAASLADTDGVFFTGSLVEWGEPGARQWEVITCLGNVLAHAEGREEVERFLDLAAGHLVEGGRLLIQTVNFDRVLDGKEWDFDPLERTGPSGERIVFQRHYTQEVDRLRFRTLLSGEGLRIENETTLLPIRAGDLVELAARQFGRVELSGDYTGSDWTESSPATILTAGIPR
jgi:SAM-dependent methyltransferase